MRDEHRSHQDDLVSFVRGVGSGTSELVEEDFGAGFYRLHTSEAEKRQAQHDIRYVEDALLELLRNARDAKATHIAVASQLRRSRFRELVVIDNGEGIPSGYHELVFEPRVTSRVRAFIEDAYGVHGRGMALYAIKTRSHVSEIAFSEPGSGAAVKVTFDIESLPERKNQAERPRLVRSSDGYELKGVHNILYVVTDFALQNPACEVVYGTHAEILAWLLRAPEFAPLVRRFGLDPHAKRFSYSAVERVARALGLSISPRNLYRVSTGDVSAPVRLSAARMRTAGRRVRIDGTLKFTREDWDQVKSAIEHALQPHLEAYGLTIVGMKQVRKNGELKLHIELAETDENFQ
jgi:hypothetical protein